MKLLRTAFVLLCMSSCVAAGCTKCEPQTLSAEAEACRSRIVAFRVDVGFDDVKLLRDGRSIVEQTLSLTNGQERIALLREFVREFYRIDISKCTVKEASCMLGRYCLMPEYLAYGLIRAGGSKEEAWKVLITGLGKYKSLCFAYGDENDMSDGNGNEARERRRIARWGRKSWKGCLQFCRDHTIKSVFGGDGDKETVEQLKTRLRKKFDMGND